MNNYVSPREITMQAQVGQEVAVSGKFGDPKFLTVAKVMKQYITLSDGSCFSKVHGYEVKVSQWQRRTLMTAESARELITYTQEKHAVAVLRNKVMEKDWKWASKELCEEVLAVIAKHDAVKETR